MVNAKVYANVDLFKSSFYLKVAVGMVKTEEEGFDILYFQGSARGNNGQSKKP
jgi:hypothetical protein